MVKRYGERVHKLTINAGFTCPNRDGKTGMGGCTFCNNSSFNQNDIKQIEQQLIHGREVIKKRTGARRSIAYFQAYTNTYEQVHILKTLYDKALEDPDIIGISIGTRPDCVPDEVLDLLASYQSKGYEVWLELGLQSSFDSTLKTINRGHDFACYKKAIAAAQKRQLQVCTHLILGLPDETQSHAMTTLERVLDLGVQGLKLHPLHVVKGTQLANTWRRGEYTPLELDDYVSTVTKMIEYTPPDVVFHRVTATAPLHLLLAPLWCAKKWIVINAITQSLHKSRLTDSGIYYGSRLSGRQPALAQNRC